MITKTWYDPCPKCQGEVSGLSYDVETIRSNPESIIAVPNAACPYDEDDPDGPDCICTAVPNFAPDPMLDEVIPIGATFTMSPCGHAIHAPRGSGGGMGGEMAGWKVYQQQIPEPGSLGELMQDWAAMDGGLP